MEEPGTKSFDESSDAFHRLSLRENNTGTGGGITALRAGSLASQNDSDTRSLCSQRSGYSSAGGGGGGDPLHSSIRSVGSVGSQGSVDYRAGLPLHVGHVHFGQAFGTSHILSGEVPHNFHPSLYQASVDAPKSDAATVCSGSVLEDIEVESHVSGDADGHHGSLASPGGNSKYHPSPPSSVKMAPIPGLRRSNSAEGNRLVDFADRSQVALAPMLSRHLRQPSQGGGPVIASSIAESMSTAGTSETANMDDDSDIASAHATTARATTGMGPPLSRTWLLQQHGTTHSRPGSVKSFESNTGSDLAAHIGSDCGGSLTDTHSILSQDDAFMTATSESGDNNARGSDVPKGYSDGVDLGEAATDDSINQHSNQLLHNYLSNRNGRLSPGGTTSRGRGIRRVNGRFMNLPLKRFHHNGVHLGAVGEHDDDVSNIGGSIDLASYDDRWQDRGYSAMKEGYQKTYHTYYGQRSERKRSRSRSRSRSPSPSNFKGESEPKNGTYTHIGSENGRYSSRPRFQHTVDPTTSNGLRNGIKLKDPPPSSSSSSKT